MQFFESWAEKDLIETGINKRIMAMLYERKDSVRIKNSFCESSFGWRITSEYKWICAVSVLQKPSLTW